MFSLSVFNLRGGLFSSGAVEKPVTCAFQGILLSPYFLSAMLSFFNIRSVDTERHICYYLELNTVRRGAT